MSEIVIIGASGLGKEVAWIAKRAGVQVRGFLDDNLALAGTEFYRRPILGVVNDWPHYADTKFIFAVAAPRVKQLLLSRMIALGNPEFAILIDPAVEVDLAETSVGHGSIIAAGTVCTADTIIGKHCMINKLCSIGHDAVINNFSTLSPQVMLGGNTVIEQGAEIGAASLVRQGLRIGAGAVVGMGSVVTKNVPPSVTVVGNPARPLSR